MEKKLLIKALNKIRNGTLEVKFWDGDLKSFGKGNPKSRIEIKDKKVIRKALKNTNVTLGEAYMDGKIVVSEPVDNLVKIAELNPMDIEQNSMVARLRALQKNKKSKQRKFIAHHYDIGNDFYKLWLDPSLTYSCAYFKKENDSLEQAQKQKIDHILKKLRLEPGMRLLDIGSGWGDLLLKAARKYKISGLGVTLSSEQVKIANQRAKEMGLDNLVKFKLLNYQDIPEEEQFERIVSVGFFEHVGRDNLAQYFKVIDKHLKDNCVSVLHCITHQVESPSDGWIDKYIFPGGYLASVREITRLMSEYGFYIFDYENLGQHYGKTIDFWRKNYEAHKKDVIKMFDERFYRMWRLYLIGSMLTFKQGNSHLSQWIFKKGQNPDWPLTREYLYK